MCGDLGFRRGLGNKREDLGARFLVGGVGLSFSFVVIIYSWNFSLFFCKWGIR